MAADYPRLLVDRDVVVMRHGQPEPEGLMVAVQGARLDTFPSGMARDMGAGLKVYIMRPGRRGSREDLVPTFDDAPPDQLATVDQQREYAAAWRADRTKR